MTDPIDPTHQDAVAALAWVRAEFAVLHTLVQVWEPRPCPQEPTWRR